MKKVKRSIAILLALMSIMLAFTSCAKSFDSEEFVDADSTWATLKQVLTGKVVNEDLSENAELVKFMAFDSATSKEVEVKCELPNNIDFSGIKKALENKDNKYVINQKDGHKFVEGPGFKANYLDNEKGFKLENLRHVTLGDNKYYSIKGEVIVTVTTEADETKYTVWNGFYWVEKADGSSKFFNNEGVEISQDEFNRLTVYKKGHSLFEEKFLLK